MTQELKACPFCGGAPKSGDSSYGYWLVYCPDSNLCDVSPSSEGATETDAVAAWNARTPDSVIAELVSCVRDCADVLGPLAKEPNVNPWLAQANALLAKLEASK